MKNKFTAIMVLTVSLTMLLMLVCGSAQGKTGTHFPSKDITFLIGNAPGGANDLTARALIPAMEKALGRNVIPVNLEGANGAVAAIKMARDPADGHEILIHSQSLIMMQYTGQPDVNIKNYQPIIEVAEDIPAVTVAADAKWKDLKEFISYARSNPRKVKVATSGAGSVWHIAGVKLEKATGVQFSFIPYQGGGAKSSVAVASHEVDATTTSAAEVKPLVDSGKLKVLAVLSDERHPLYPNIPTAKELGIDVSYPVWRGIFCRKGAPAEAVKALHDAIKAAIESEGYRKFMETSGFPIKYRGTEEFTKMVQQEDEFHKALLTELGLKISDPR
ncbi:MAG TPA: tripartite tricarboxylate transporter substrate binding protein [Firmicutes bacterium]|nr:tripartite tricarboxylate transporter substrate binding protein [Bacillota bacterium]